MKLRALNLGVTNCYLLANGDRCILVDTGYDVQWERLVKLLADAGIVPSNITHLVLTHHHDDHSGLLNRMVQANKEIRVVMSRRASALLARGRNDLTHSPAYVNKRVNLLFSLIRRFDKRWQGHTFQPYSTRIGDFSIEGRTDLDEVGIGLGVRGTLLETPGHSVDSISLLLEDGTCIVGDAAANLPALLGTHYCVIIMEDIDEYYRSWNKLVAAGARRILPAHGPPFGVEELKRNLGRIKRSDLVPIV